MSSKGIFLIDKFFDEGQYSDIINDMNYSFDHMPLLDNKTWGETVTEFSKPIKIKVLETKDTHYQLIKNNIYHLIGRHPDGIYYYYWGPGSYIPWHADEIYSSAFTIYMNENWNYQDGGLFQYYINGKIETLVPHANLAVMQTGKVPHSTTILSKNAPIRKSIQVWFEKGNNRPVKSAI